MTFLCVFCWRMAWLSSLLAILLEWLCHSVWLFHLHSTVKRQPFSPVFPLAESITEAFFWLFLWNFKEKSINHFLGHSLWNLKGGTGSCWLWRSLEEKGGVFFRGREGGRWEAGETKACLPLYFSLRPQKKEHNLRIPQSRRGKAKPFALSAALGRFGGIRPKGGGEAVPLGGLAGLRRIVCGAIPLK